MIFNVPPLLVVPGVLATFDLPAADDNFTLLYCRLTDPLSKWPKAVDDTRHIIEYGVQIRRRGSPRWEWATVQREPGGLAFGTPCRDGVSVAETEDEKLDPSLMAIDADPSKPPQFVAPIGGIFSKLRLAILTDAPFTFGAIVRTDKPARVAGSILVGIDPESSAL